MMINWAEKQAPEDRQLTEDVLDAMTIIRGWASQEKLFVESEDEQEQRDNPSYVMRSGARNEPRLAVPS